MLIWHEALAPSRLGRIPKKVLDRELEYLARKN